MNKKAEARWPTYVLLDRADRKQIDQLAEEEGLSASTFIRRMVMRELRGREKNTE